MRPEFGGADQDEVSGMRPAIQDRQAPFGIVRFMILSILAAGYRTICGPRAQPALA
jgi:hypothetical protein